MSDNMSEEKQKDDDNRMWTDEEIKELEKKADKENALDIMTQMTIQDTATILRISEEAAFWKRLFLIGLTVFLTIELLWIFLYLMVNTDIVSNIWYFINDLMRDIVNFIYDFLRGIVNSLSFGIIFTITSS